MADRVPAFIAIGGRLDAALFSELVETVQAEGLSLDWGGEPFEPEHRQIAEPLTLYAENVAWGRFDALEPFCVAHGLPFVRWAGGCPGQWSPERIVYRGSGEPASYMVDESDRVVIDRYHVEQIGSVDALLSYFEGAGFDVPPLVLAGDPDVSADRETVAGDPSLGEKASHG
ncbi:hypothetical protein [Sphingopyxis sp. JAI108]|uniref:hypothetical protein n=1 Tax=Sphingopyxis sp. JAI108 TaxID=2723060 RepID=UPI0015C9B25E|nr:hypothetical protein [Sphingopyxis sp. JAI108]NYF33621.1 hypothetical protein [Sphingopyxis sp. JAI108]